MATVLVAGESTQATPSWGVTAPPDRAPRATAATTRISIPVTARVTSRREATAGPGPGGYDDPRRAGSPVSQAIRVLPRCGIRPKTHVTGRNVLSGSQ